LWLTLMPLLRLRVYIGRMLLAAALIAIGVAVVRLLGPDRSWRPVVTAGLVGAVAYVGTSVIAATDPFVILAPANPAASLMQYGAALEAHHDFGAARAAYEQARVYHPESPIVQAALHRLAALPPSGSSRSDADVQYRTGASSAWLILQVGRGLWGAMGDRISAGALPAGSDGLSALSPSQLGAEREKFAATGGSSAVAGQARIAGWIDVVRLAPTIGATALFAPFPWDVLRPRGITGAFRTFAVVEPLLMLGVLPALIFAIGRVRQPQDWFVAAFAACGAFALAYVIPNVGTLVRLRAGFTLILVGLAAFGWKDYARLLGAVVRRSPVLASATQRDAS
jgi:hypothetical protein